MRYDTKIALVVRDDLAPWQKLNVTAFLTGGLVGCHPELPGEPYQDGSGRFYDPLIRQPILIFAATGADLARTLSRARERGLRPSIYTHDLFATGNDADNRAAVASVPTEAARPRRPRAPRRPQGDRQGGQGTEPARMRREERCRWERWHTSSRPSPSTGRRV